MDKAIGKKTWQDYLFFMFVGSIFVFSVNRAIISSTFIRIGSLTLFVMGVIGLLACAAVLFNKYTRIAALVVTLLVAFRLYRALEYFNEQFPHLYELFLMTTGQLPFRQDLGVTATWFIVFISAFATTVLLLHLKSYYALGAAGVIVFLVTWIPGFTRDEIAFLYFMVAFCILLIRKTNKQVQAAAVAVPLSVIVVLLAHLILPTHSDFYLRRQLRYGGDGPLTAIGDRLFELFNPVHFSFQTTGFAGAGGRLGGPVSLNNRSVMTVNAPGRIYLSGAVSNFYTGHSWISTLGPGDINTHGLLPGHFEMLETAAALIRYTMQVEQSRSFSVTGLGLHADENRLIYDHHFSVLGVSDPLMLEDFYLHAYLPFDVMTIAIGTNRTGTIFRPTRMNHIWFYHGGTNYLSYAEVSPLGDLRTPGFMSRGTTYHMQFLNVRQQLTFLDSILQGTGQGIYASRQFNQEDAPARTLLTTTLDRRALQTAALLPSYGIGIAEFMAILDLFSSHGTVSYVASKYELMQALDYFSATILAEYAREVREHFTYVPESVPWRVHELTHQIIEGLYTDYEKAIAIRNFLLEFRYTLTPVHVPRGVCFVDFFLFEGQEGYCTYFASAMAIMGRIAGIPTRYVEGFVIPPTPDRDSSVVVSNRMAHAWVEIYLEGFGWYVIEATPTYAFLLGYVEFLTAFPGGLDAQFLDWWEFDDLWWYFEEDDWLYGLEWPFGGGQPGQPGFGGVGGDVTGAAGAGMLRGFAMFLTLLFSAILLFVLFRNIQFKRRLKKVKSLPPNKQAQVYFKAILQVMEHTFEPMQAGMTPKAFGRVLGKRFSFKSDTVFLSDLAHIYYKAKYSTCEISESELRHMEESYHEMTWWLKMEESKPVYYYLKLVKRMGTV